MGAHRRDSLMVGFAIVITGLASFAFALAARPAAAQLPAVPEVPQLPQLPEAPDLPEVPGAPEVDVPSTNETVDVVRDTVNDATGGGDGGEDAGSAAPPPAAPEAPAADPAIGGGAPTQQGDRDSSGPLDPPAGSPQSDGNGPARSSGDSGPGARAEEFAAGSPRPETDRVPPASGAQEDATLASRFGEAIASLPSGVLIGLLALAALALLMTGRSAWFARATDSLKLQRRALRDDVDVLQSALVPVVPAEIAGTAIAVSYRPAAGPAAGGDFHDAFDLGDGRVGVVVGDVSGHGPEALPSTAIIRYTIRAYLEAGLEPRAALRLADRALAGSIGGDFATAIAAVYDSNSDRLTYSAAGHPPPIVVGGHGHRAVPAMSAPPIGLGPASGSRQTTISVGPGARIWLFTDGLIESRSGDGLLGREGLACLLAEAPDPAGLLERVAGPAESTADDMTACSIRPSGASDTEEAIEEVEIGADTPRESLAEFAAACGLGEADVAALLAQTTGAARGGAARLLRISRRGARIGWEVGADDVRRLAGAPGGALREGLGEAMRIPG